MKPALFACLVSTYGQGFQSQERLTQNRAMRPTLRIHSHPSRQRSLWRALFALAPLCLLLGCYDSDSIQSAAPSPDGRRLALTTAQRELGVLDLQRDEPPKVYSHQAGDGVAWSTDSRKLVYIDQPEAGPSALMQLDAAQGRAVELLRDPSWKAQPAWLADGRIAYLSDAESDHAGVWVYDAKKRDAARLMQRDADVSRLWVAPGGEHLIFQTINAGASELWHWRLPDGKITQLTQDKPNAPASETGLAFAADGAHIAYCAVYADRVELVWQELATGAVADRLPLAQPATLTVTGDGHVAAGQGNEVVLWRPSARWWQARVIRVGWNAMPLRVLAPLGERGLTLALNENIMLLAKSAGAPESGRLQARRVEDLLALAYPLAHNGRFGVARNLLKGIEARAAKGSRDEFLVAMAFSQLERMQGQWRQADQWLARALRAAEPGGAEEEAAWLERLALAVFNAQDRPLANWIVQKLPPGTDEAGLTAWTRRLLENPGSRSAAAWTEIGARFRRREDAEVAHLVYKALEGNNPSTTTLQGVAMLLGGDLEPLGEVADYGQRRLDALMGQPEFQIALLGIIRRNLRGGPSVAELSALLFAQWVRQGDFSSARELVRASLKTSVQAMTEYQEMLRRFLVIEEIPRWTQRAVTDVLLQRDIADSLADRMTTPDEKLALRLAQAKKAIMDGEPQTARAWLADAQTLAAKMESPDGDPAAAFERAQLTFLIHLFKAKVAERERHWLDAIRAYEECLRLMNDSPGAWDVSPFEVGAMAELIRIGSARDPDLLRSYLEIVRGTGDPLINPSHLPATLQVGLSNVATLRRVANDPWILPYLSYTEGLYYSLGGQSWRALGLLQRARALGPSPALLRRILLEEAAVRDNLGQHNVAAQLYRRIFASADAPVSQRASALQAAIESEAASGAVAAPTDRLKQRLKDTPLTPKWRAWLGQQFGVDAGA